MSIQPQFKESLLEAVKVFKCDTDSFLGRYNEVCDGCSHASTNFTLLHILDWTHGGRSGPQGSQ